MNGDAIYTYCPCPGDEIMVARSSRADGAPLIRARSQSTFGAAVPPADIPAVARKLAEAMHEAAGKPAPIILERLEVLGNPDSRILGTAFEVSHRPGWVRLGFDERNGHMLNTSPENARFIAALIAQHADAAGKAAGPDPAEVEALADVIRESASMRSTDIAGAILRAGWRPPERKEGDR